MGMEERQKSLTDPYNKVDDLIEVFDNVDEFIEYFDKGNLGLATWKAKLETLREVLYAIGVSDRSFIQMYEIFEFMSKLYKKNYYLRELVTILKYEATKGTNSRDFSGRKNWRVSRAEKRSRYIYRKRRGLL
jgi:hypothetical protein